MLEDLALILCPFLQLQLAQRCEKEEGGHELNAVERGERIEHPLPAAHLCPLLAL